MSKKSLFISAILTTFVLVVVASVTAVYGQTRETAVSQPVAAAPTLLPTQEPVAQVTQVTYQEAADLASSYLGETDLYSIENTVWNGVDAYKVVFSSGYVVYVGLDGQILGSEAPQPIFVAAPTQAQKVKQPQSTNNSSSNNEGHHEHEGHEGGDDD